MASLQPGSVVMSEPGLLPRAISLLVTLIQPWWSVLMFLAPITKEGPTYTQSLSHDL